MPVVAWLRTDLAYWLLNHKSSWDTLVQLQVSRWLFRFWTLIWLLHSILCPALYRLEDDPWAKEQLYTAASVFAELIAWHTRFARPVAAIVVGYCGKFRLPAANLEIEHV